jgi:hypothetical protein
MSIFKNPALDLKKETSFTFGRARGGSISHNKVKGFLVMFKGARNAFRDSLKVVM